MIGHADYSDIFSFSREALRGAFSDLPDAMDMMIISAVKAKLASGDPLYILVITVSILVATA